jgi:TonB-linked SusC/RagA family outer membrane protein
MKKTFKLILLVCCASLAALSAQAQETKTITGTVVDKSKEPIPGVTVQVEGTHIGAMTDFDGNFELAAPEGAVLKVSMTGYEPQTRKITASTTYPFTLQTNSKAEELEEVVAVGYATQKKSELTGSITSVKASDVKDFSSKSLAESLGGMAAGVSVTKNSGSPGEEADIMIRGVGSINGMKPLYIVDGVRQGAGFNFNMRDVESIEILKDAGSAAIYGAQAAGGVILITTKKGAKGADCNGIASVTVNARYGIRNIYSDIKLLDRDGYLKAQTLTNPNADPMASVLAGFNVSSADQLPNVDWMKELYGTGTEQEYNIALSGGNEKTTFYLSASYYDEKGTFLDTEAKRFSLRSNLEHKFNKHITIGESVYGSARKGNPAHKNGLYENSIPFDGLPIVSPKDADGNWSKLPNGHAVPNLYANELVYHVVNDIGYTGNIQVYANINFIDGLDWRTTAAGEFYGESKNYYTEAYDWGTVKSANSTMYSKAGTSSNLTFNSTLTYDTKRLLGDHNIKVMIGTEALKYDSYGLEVNASDFPLPVSKSLRLLGGETGPWDKQAWDNPWLSRSLSVFGRLNYNYMGKYLLTANIRRDGSDKFGPNNKWGTFPSVNAGWRVSEESFVKDNVKWLDNAKIRASYGILGNDNINQFLYSAYYVTTPKYTFDGKEENGYQLRSLANNDIKWEEVHQLDLGIDLAFLNNRLSITYDYYNRQTQGMLYDKQVPLVSGVAWYFGSGMDDILIPIKTNAGKMENKGHEVTVIWNDKTAFGLKYTVGANASFNSNLMKSIGSYAGEAAPYDSELSGWGAPVTRTADGNPVSLFYGYKVKGIFSSQEQVDAYNQSAKDKVGSTYYYQTSKTGVGDLIFEDVNGDGRISDDDRTFIGNPWPKAVLGLNINLEWKGFDLGLNFQSALGFDIYNAVKQYTESFRGQNTTADYFNASFLGDNGLTDQPRVGYWDVKANGTKRWVGDDAANKNYSTVSSYFVEKGDYLKLKNLVVGYTLPEKIAKKVYMQNFRIYMSAQNIFTITKYSGIDPEIAGDVLQRGVDTYTRYLPSRLFSLGVDLTF